MLRYIIYVFYDDRMLVMICLCFSGMLSCSKLGHMALGMPTMLYTTTW